MTKGAVHVEGQWLQDELDRLELNAPDVGKMLDCEPNKIYNHVKNKTKLQAGVLAALWIAYPTIDMRYILTGQRERSAAKVYIRTEGQVDIITE